MNIQENLAHVQQTIQRACLRSNRSPDDVTIIAVTKYTDVQGTKNVLDAGIEHVAENRVDSAVHKWQQLNANGIWHFIGHLQSNKVKKIIGRYTYIHSLDRLSLAKEIEKRAQQRDVSVPCFVQVNVSGETTKQGVSVTEAHDFVVEMANYSRIRVIGLMTMAPMVDHAEEVRPVFRELKQLQQTLHQKKWPHAPITQLSMGMSNDYSIAVEEGATFLRLGSCLTGSGSVSDQ